MYGLGAHMARSKGACSAAMLMQKLRLAPEAAQAMQAQLIRNGIISLPNAAGVAAAAQPYMRAAPVLTSTLPAAGDKAKQAVRSWVKTQVEEAKAPEKDNST